MYPIVSTPELLQHSTQLFVHRVQTCALHRHQAVEALWILQGAIRVQVHNRQHSLNQGDILFINANDHHATEAASDDNLVLCLQHRFTDLQSVVVSPQPANPVLLARQNDIRSMLAHLWWEQKHQSIHWQRASETFLARLQLALMRYFTAAESGTPTPLPHGSLRIQQIIRHLENHYRESQTLSGLAKHFSISESYLSHYFKTQTGSTLVRWLTQLRLERCLTDLVQTDTAISELALDHGFRSIKAFNLAFKREYQCTPSEFRKRQAQTQSRHTAGRQYAPFSDSAVDTLITPWLNRTELFLE